MDPRLEKPVPMLREFRKEKGFTIRRLAEKLKMTPTALCRIENGERIPEPEQVGAICDALGLNKTERMDLLFSFGYMEFGNVQ